MFSEKRAGAFLPGLPSNGSNVLMGPRANHVQVISEVSTPVATPVRGKGKGHGHPGKITPRATTPEKVCPRSPPSAPSSSRPSAQVLQAPPSPTPSTTSSMYDDGTYWKKLGLQVHASIRHACMLITLASTVQKLRECCQG